MKREQVESRLKIKINSSFVVKDGSSNTGILEFTRQIGNIVSIPCTG